MKAAFTARKGVMADIGLAVRSVSAVRLARGCDWAYRAGPALWQIEWSQTWL